MPVESRTTGATQHRAAPIGPPGTRRERRTGRSAAVAVIGAGRTGVRLVERLRANAPKSLPGVTLDIHLVDPHPPDSDRPLDRPDTGNVRVHLHRATAVDLADVFGRQRVALSTGRFHDVETVILAQGRRGVPPTPEEQALDDFAVRHGLTYLPTGELRPDLVPGGEPVIVRGIGHVFAELVGPLTSGRGGRFVHDRDGELGYLPSGREPLLHVGSRRGVPYHAAPGYPSRGARPPIPRFLTPDPPARGAVDAGRGLRTLIAKELAFAYYHGLITGHPERARMDWPEFEAAFAAAEWDDGAMRALIRNAVPRHADRLRLDRLDRPLHGIRFGDTAGLQRWMHGYLTADLGRRADPAYSADLALIQGMHAVRAVLSGRPPDPWFDSLSRFVADGPSWLRTAELRALARAGVVTFLGAGLRAEPDEERRAWRARGSTLPGALTARTLVEARPSAPSVSRTTDPLLSRLWARGECQEESGLLAVRPSDRRLIDRAQAVHPRRFALGPWVLAGEPAGLSAPADTLARTVLAETGTACLTVAA
ncbi:NAD(P)/FAD-dependent oxidoreductase [Streptosporangium soli]|nr:hypothetical protein [Streptosporangium sp. KLBMP 9127]